MSDTVSASVLSLEGSPAVGTRGRWGWTGFTQLYSHHGTKKNSICLLTMTVFFFLLKATTEGRVAPLGRQMGSAV